MPKPPEDAPPLEHRPRLIALDPEDVKLEDGSEGIALRDPLGVVPHVAVVSPSAFWVLSHFDGRRTVAEIVAALRAEVDGIDGAVVERLAHDLRKAGLVHGPEHRALKDRAVAEYRAAPVREPSCAGGVYPTDAGALREQLDGFFLHAEGPGPLDRARRSRARASLLVAPHIDYHRGGASYAHAYRALHERGGADLFVVLGTAHATPPRLFTLTVKDYATPLGPVPTDRAVVDALCEELGEDELLSEELHHRGEHSVELQMPWLRHLYPDREIRALPVLCSSIARLRNPEARTEPFLQALSRIVKGRKVCFVAAADLAHVGPRYGDERAPTPEELRRLADEDRRTLRFVEAGDAEGFRQDALLDDGRRRLCGVAPIYAAMRLSGAGARLLHHGQWTDGVDSVSYAAAVG
jgi:AmmeMemoRadiSam system protein B